MHSKRDPPAAFTTGSGMSMSAPKPERKRLGGCVKNTVYQTNKMGKPLARAKNRSQIKCNFRRRWLGVAKMLGRCSELRQFYGTKALLDGCRLGYCAQKTNLEL
jgi:hypothetical protein